MLRTLLRIAARGGQDGTLVSASEVPDGSLLYLTLAVDPVHITASLDAGDVEQLHAAAGEWLRRRAAADPAPAPLVAGSIRRGQLDAATVQNRTVAHPPRLPDQRGRGEVVRLLRDV